MVGHPKLRGVLQCLPTSPGVLFRIGESILPVRGRAVQEWYRQISHLQEHRSHYPKELAELSARNPLVFDQLCEALKTADMLYDASGDDLDIVPSSVQIQFRSQISRMELKSAQPLKTFGIVRRKRLLISGTSDLVWSLAEAALESGLGNIALHTPDSPSAAIEIASEFRHHYANCVSGTVIDTLSCNASRDHLDASQRFDYLLTAGVAGEEWPILQEYLDSFLATPGSIAFVACLGATHIIAGCLDATDSGGCSECLANYCLQASACEDEIAPAYGYRDSIAIGARLVVQHLWDVVTEHSEERISNCIFDFDISRCSLQRRPRPVILAKCCRCRTFPYLTIQHAWPYAKKGEQIPIQELCSKAERLYVDNRTGLIAEIEEGDLLQFPVYQCAALVNANFCARKFGWITECGDDPLLARNNVLRRALESLYEYVLERQSAAPDFFDCPSNTELMYQCPELTRPTKIVVSSLRSEDLKFEAFYRALARYAHSLDSWQELNPRMLSVGTKSSNIFQHLRETDLLQYVNVEHCGFEKQNCHVARFSYEKEVVSIVAGSELESIFTIGFRDVWLLVSAREAILDSRLETGIRFRAAGRVPGAYDLSRQIRSVEREIGQNLILSALTDGKMNTVRLYFAAVSFIADKDSGHCSPSHTQ